MHYILSDIETNPARPHDGHLLADRLRSGDNIDIADDLGMSNTLNVRDAR